MTKRLVAGAWERQSQKAYRLHARAMWVMDWEDAQIALQVSAESVLQGEGTRASFEAQLDEAYDEIVRRWQEIQARLVAAWKPCSEGEDRSSTGSASGPRST